MVDKLLGAVSKIKSLNWQLILFKLGIIAAFGGMLVLYGYGQGKEACLEDKVSEVQEEKKKVIDFIPAVADQERTAAQQEARTERRRIEYEQEVDRAARPSTCDLSDDELRSFQELVKG